MAVPSGGIREKAPSARRCPDTRVSGTRALVVAMVVVVVVVVRGEQTIAPKLGGV